MKFDRLTRWILTASAVVLAFHLAVAVQVGFLSDDFAYLRAVDTLESADDYISFISKPLGTAFEWRPATGVWWIIESALFGNTSWLYHLTRIGVIAITLWWLFRIGSRLFNPLSGSLAVLVFVLMPFHAEALYWLADITDLLGLAGSLGAIWLGLRWLETGRVRILVAAALLLFIGLTGKEFAIATLPILLLVDVAINGFQNQKLQKQRLIIYGVFLLITLATLGWRSHVLGSLSGDTRGRSPIESVFSLEPYTAMASRMMMLVSLEALRDISPEAVSVWVHLRKILAAVLVISLLAIAWKKFSDRKFVIAIVVSLGILWLYAAPQAFVLPFISLNSLQHARFLYAPSLGLALLLAGLLGAGVQVGGWRQRGSVAVTTVMLTFFGIFSIVNAQPWLQAAEQREVVLNDLAEHHPNIVTGAIPITLYVENIPEQINGAFIFRDKPSFGEAFKRRFENPNVTIVRLEENAEAKTACLRGPAVGIVCLSWTDQGFVLID